MHAHAGRQTHATPTHRADRGKARRGDLVYDTEYLAIARTDNVVVVRITLSAGRSLELKRALYRRLADNLAQAVGLRPQDAWVKLVEVAKENWSFGHGVACYAPADAVTA